jgi:hypothetical protein
MSVLSSFATHVDGYFTPVPELNAGFDLLYVQKFAEARQIFASWEFRNREDPFGEVAMAASYLFEELYSKAY